MITLPAGAVSVILPPSFAVAHMVPCAERLVKITGAVGILLHTTWLAGWSTVGVGLTSTVAVIGVPLQVTGPVVTLGVIVNVTNTVVFVVFVNAPLIFPTPLAVIPVTFTVLSRVQL